MGYFLLDADSNYLGDLATARGIFEIRRYAGPELERFLNRAIANHVACEAVFRETKGTALHYIGELLMKGKPPIIITDGSTRG